ncbi:MAG: hypothetical protein GZ090_01550 [Oxalobacteraceae bacterium]|nr:hypothetical protein [Oxalobacteraceae bacterium]
MSNDNLPKTATRARRVLDALFSFPSGPVEEAALMTRHYLNNSSAANWRKYVYQQLQDTFLITCHDSSSGRDCWALTDKGRRLILAEQRNLAGCTHPTQDAQTVIDVPIVPPRTQRDWRPMAAGAFGMRVMRDGALDYQSIPSMVGGRRCV